MHKVNFKKIVLVFVLKTKGLSGPYNLFWDENDGGVSDKCHGFLRAQLKDRIKSKISDSPSVSFSSFKNKVHSIIHMNLFARK